MMALTYFLIFFRPNHPLFTLVTVGATTPTTLTATATITHRPITIPNALLAYFQPNM